MSTNATQQPTETTLPPEQDQRTSGDNNIGTSGTAPNSHYIPLDECQCTICTEYFINAVETNCHHRFCNFCIHRWFTSTGRHQCPTCRCNITQLNPLPSLDNSIQRMIVSLSGDQLLERERIRNRRHHSDNRNSNRNAFGTGHRRNGPGAGISIFTEDGPILTLPTPRLPSTNVRENTNLTPGNPVPPNPDIPEANGANTNPASSDITSNRRYIDEMTDTMNDYEYHLSRAQAAHRRMVQARSDYEIQENRLHILFNRFVTLSAAAELNTNGEMPAAPDRNMNMSGNDGILDSDFDDFAMTPISRPSTLGLGAMTSQNQRYTSENYINFDSLRQTRNYSRSSRSPWGFRPALVTPPLMEQSRVDTSLGNPERLEPAERMARFRRVANTRPRDTYVTSILNSRRPSLNDVISLRNDITRNASQTRASYDRHASLRREMSLNRRRLDQLRDERNRFQTQVGNLEAQTIGNVANSTGFRENEGSTNRETRRVPTVNRADIELPTITNVNTTRLADEINDMWENFRTRVAREQPLPVEDSDSDEADQPIRDNDVDELRSPQDDGEGDSDPELRIEFRTPTMTLKMTNFSQK